MSDYNGDERRVSQSSQSQRPRQEGATTNPISLPALPDIPSSDLDLGSIIVPSELDSPNPEQWAELDFQFRGREGS